MIYRNDGRKQPDEVMTPMFGKQGLFGDVKPGGSADFGSFTARNIPGGMTVIAGKPSQLGMMDVLRSQGLTPEQATSAVVGASASNLDLIKAGLLPDTAKAEVAQGLAQARRLNVDADLAPRLANSTVGYQAALSDQFRANAAETRRGTSHASEGWGLNWELPDFTSTANRNWFRLPSSR